MSDSFLTRGRLAIWNEIDADSDIQGALRGGKVFRFEGGLMEKFDTVRAICPFVVIGLWKGELPQASNAEWEWTHWLAVKMGVYMDLAPCEWLFECIVERLCSPRVQYFGLGGTGFLGLRFGAPEWQAEPDGENGPDIIWTCTLPVGLKFRRRKKTV